MFSPHDNECTVKARSLFQQSVLQFRKNRFAVFGLIVIAALFIIALGTIAVDIATDNEFYNTHVINQDLSLRLAPPSAEHIFGCDEFGRDIFLRIIWGTKYSLFIGIGALILALAIGMPLGMISGYYGGKIDSVISRIMEIFQAFPDLIFAMAIMTFMGKGVVNLFIALGLLTWVRTARMIRGSVMQLKEKEYIEASRASGATTYWIIMKGLIPNCLSTIIVLVTLGIPNAIMYEASLSFLGIGIVPPTPSWGNMISAAQTFINYRPLYSIMPGVAIMITVIAFNIFGDGLRDALDPKLKN